MLMDNPFILHLITHGTAPLGLPNPIPGTTADLCQIINLEEASKIYAMAMVLETLGQGCASLAFASGLIYHLALREWIRFQHVGMAAINAISAMHSAQSSTQSRQPHESSAQPQG